MTRQLFLDMDGVLADFDEGYEQAFGVRPDKGIDNVDWELVRRTENFYRDLPAMPDMQRLWDFCRAYDPIVLTGVPWGVPEAADNKRAWVAKNLGENVEIRCVASREKVKHCKPGDVLVDDWEKYKHLWVDAGGVWITHTSAAGSIAELLPLFPKVRTAVSWGPDADPHRLV
ncbi:MAG: hypothetical protein GY906_23195 [bacterium]|nr:hypothetical protein [bacterium]